MSDGQGLKGLLKFLAWAGGAILSALAPWVQNFLYSQLISDYFQPIAKRLARGVALIAFLVAYAVLRRRDDQQKRATITRWLIVAAICFCVTLFLSLTMGTVIAPGRLGTTLLWGTWYLAYLGLFVAIAIILAAAAPLIVSNGSSPGDAQNTTPERQEPEDGAVSDSSTGQGAGE